MPYDQGEEVGLSKPPRAFREVAPAWNKLKIGALLTRDIAGRRGQLLPTEDPKEDGHDLQRERSSLTQKRHIFSPSIAYPRSCGSFSHTSRAPTDPYSPSSRKDGTSNHDVQEGPFLNRSLLAEGH